MSRHIVEAPDGTRHIIEGPDEAPAAKEATPVLDRLVTGFMDPVVGAAQIMEKTGVPGVLRKALGVQSDMDDVSRRREAEYKAPEGVDWARMGGNMVNPMSWAGGGAGVGRAALSGAVQGALTPTSPDQNFGLEKAKQAALGGAVGGAVGKLVHGFRPTREAAALMEQGVQPSFGQAMGGAVNSAEQKAMSLPILGRAVASARARPTTEVGERAIERATGGAASTLDAANTHAEHLFDSVVPHLRPTPEVVQNVAQATNEALQNPRLGTEGRRVLDGLVTEYFARFGDMDGAAIKQLDSQMGHDIRTYMAGDPNHRALATALQAVQQAFRQGLEAGVPQELQGALRAANTTWRNLVPLNKAASARADEVITPRNLQKALARQAGRDVTRMPPDPLIDNAVRVLPNTVPDSGTAGRLFLTDPVGLAIGAGTGAVGALGGTRTGQAALVGNTRLQRAARPYADNLSALMAAALRGEAQ